ncbi:30S ribosomal protein S1 [Pediococcus acidilactici]|uniref:30S ribosomal protein S1 n=1 Tax=Pediococcus acidilactici TaxID=1254 RepID=UPI001326E0CC|nr:30S ribosomal protein S1 [Pediococcus acidilactici]KAF0334554.1 30S ribosomal protein S1 [Pediococcus acidilactici]KAF0338672.1 30S ribosomal protein S1 [Pediococcus acidilactici]KAF0341141.1 30S ribosomal protein S1 [Pediococcus acidilactici]KAF0346163.1 30S ribosomal protein S1 [Pediococcus acidilactici]KAF0350754.1 30S ribosomal protein S1 [Pediococcus acidilactici]
MAENDVNQNRDLLNAINSVEEVKVGDVVTGEVLDIDDDRQVIVGIQGAGVEGVVPLRELSTQHIDNINDEVKIGDELELVVISRIGDDKEGGSYLLSRKRLLARKVWKEIEEKAANGEELEVPVTQVVKGGLVVDAGVRGFIPASMIENRYVDDLNAYKGQTLKVKIIEIKPEDNRLILSHKAVINAERAEKRQEVLSSLQEGEVVTGKVARLTNFGAFVDLGGIDGLVHISEISYERVEKPSDVLKPGEEVQVKVLSVDPERERISLSIKQTQPGPWENIAEKAPVGAVLDGKVKRLTDFGAFVEVFPGVEGLVHISQISHKHIATPADVLEEGQDIKVKVLEVHPEERRLALSIKALEEAPKSEKKASKAPATDYSKDMPEETTGFTLGDIIGDSLKDSDK